MSLTRRISSVAAGLAAIMVAGCSGSSGGGAAPSADQLVSAGIQRQEAGDVSAAEQLFRQALDRDPGNVYAHYNLGVIAQRANDPQGALKEYAAALVTDPKYVPALFNEATIYATTNPTLAIATYRQVIDLQPQAPTAYLNLGLLEAQEHMRGQAIRDLLVALHQDPTLGNSIPKPLLAAVGRAANRRGGGTPSTTPSASATP